MRLGGVCSDGMEEFPTSRVSWAFLSSLALHTSPPHSKFLLKPLHVGLWCASCTSRWQVSVHTGLLSHRSEPTGAHTLYPSRMRVTCFMQHPGPTPLPSKSPSLSVQVSKGRSEVALVQRREVKKGSHRARHVDCSGPGLMWVKRGAGEEAVVNCHELH